MKKLIFALVIAAGFSAQAAQVPVFKCEVPAQSGAATVTATIAVSDNEPVDYVTLELNDKSVGTLFTQMDKGAFAQAVASGNVTSLILDEQFEQGADGVIRNAGIFSVGLDNGQWNGLLSARGNIYPFNCTKL
jgi:hypothetical protein